MTSWECTKCNLVNLKSRSQCQACFESNPNYIRDTQFDVALLIFGYIRQKEATFALFMNIPPGIIQIVYKLYPVLLFKFGKHNEKALNVNDDGTILKGNNPVSHRCAGYAIYADISSISDNGLNSGIHLWSVKLLPATGNFSHYARCHASIGVTTEKYDDKMYGPRDWSSTGGWITNEGYNSLYYGCGQWNENEMITVKLDCNDWRVIYYKDEAEFKDEKLEADKCYYFAMNCCGDSSRTHFQVVETPVLD